MLRRLLIFLSAMLALALALVLFGPFLISTAPNSGLEPARAAATDDSLFVEIPFSGTQGVEIHYLAAGPRRQGDGEQFLLLHGFTFNAFTWNQVLEPFASDGRVFAYDQIPYGLSAKLTSGDWQGPNPYSKESAIAHLFAFMDALDIERATLVGNSSGGTLALEAALAQPDRFDRLILISPWVYAQRPTIPAWLAELPQFRRLSLLAGRKLGQGGLLDSSYADPERIDQVRRDLTGIHARVRNWDIAWGALINQSLSSPVEVSGRLEEIAQPVLVMTGDKDNLVAVADTRRVAAEIPNATFKMLPGCGHMPQEECPAQFERTVSEWLRSELSKASR